MLPALGEMLFLFLHFHLVTTFGKKEQSEKKRGRKKTEIRGKETDLQVTERDKEKAGDLLAQLWLYSPMSQNAYLVTWYLTGREKRG